MKKILPFIIFLILSACTEANSNKNCIGKDYQKWTNCFHRTLGEMEQNI